MIKTFPIEFVRVALLQTLKEQHLENDNYFGGDDQINIFSFYEQLKNQDEVNRFVEKYRDLTEQQNKSGLIGNGVLVSPENPTITNLYQNTIIPMTFTCSIRTKLSNRDRMIQTINNLIEELKGSKVDMAQLECHDDKGATVYVPFKVGTIGHNSGYPRIKKGDFIGADSGTLSIEGFPFDIANGLSADDYVYFQDEETGALKTALVQIPTGAGTISYDYSTMDCDVYVINQTTLGFKFTSKQSYNKTFWRTSTSNFRFEIETEDSTIQATLAIRSHGGKLNGKGQFTITTSIDVSNYGTGVASEVLGTIDLTTLSATITNAAALNYTAVEVQDDGTYTNIIFAPENFGFERYKLSMSFEAIRCDEPRALNGDEYCEISFGGSATLVNANVRLGNDLVKVSFHKNKIVASENVEFRSDNYYFLEPLEMPSGSSANTVISQLASNNFKQNTHTDGLGVILQYSFIVDDGIDLISQWFSYARYGAYAITNSGISPNMIYNIQEIWSSWGAIGIINVLGKIVDNIDIENTESDTLSLSVTFQVQGDNN